jgi:hypothetical protein
VTVQPILVSDGPSSRRSFAPGPEDGNALSLGLREQTSLGDEQFDREGEKFVINMLPKDGHLGKATRRLL